MTIDISMVIVEPPADLATPRDAYKHVLRADPCAVCSAPAGTVDHITPRSRGGRSRVDNLTGMCLPHNREKDDEKLLLWLLYRRDIELRG
jgi:5-methylcytosine-specific restriction endonuclease McrA